MAAEQHGPGLCFKDRDPNSKELKVSYSSNFTIHTPHIHAHTHHTYAHAHAHTEARPRAAPISPVYAQSEG